jgi:hypothetical protein
MAGRASPYEQAPTNRDALSLREIQDSGKGTRPNLLHAKRQDEAYFGGHREDVLKRDDYRCRVPGCLTIKRGKRSVAVHHREPRNSDPAKMLTLCLPCHAKVTRTILVQDDWPEFLRVLWRQQHPEGHEQVALNFGALAAPATNVMLFEEMRAIKAPVARS